MTWTKETRPAVRSPGRGNVKNKLATQFLKDLHDHWLENGAAAIKVAYHEDPIAYLKIVASVLPRDLVLHDGGAVADLGDDELEQLIARARAQLLEQPEPRLVGEQKADKPLKPLNPLERTALSEHEPCLELTTNPPSQSE